MPGDRGLSRRDFLRFRTTERGKVLELSCRALFMRCADAAAAPGEVVDYDSWAGEPPAVVNRRSVDEILAGFAADLEGARGLRLLEPEWLENMPGIERFRSVVSAFTERGGTIE